MAEASSKSGSAEMEDTDKEEAAEHDEPLCAAASAVPAPTPSPEPPASLMEWNWNPVRIFASRLQNLSAMRPQAPSFDFLPKLSSFSFPRLSFAGWWGGQHNKPKQDDAEAAQAPEQAQQEHTATQKQEEEHHQQKDEEQQKRNSKAQTSGGIFNFRGFFSSRKQEEAHEPKHGSDSGSDDDDDDTEDDTSEYDSSSSDEGDGDEDDDDDLFLFGNMPVNPRVPSKCSRNRLFMDKYDTKQLWSIFREKRFTAGRRAGQTFEEVFRSKGIDCVALDVDTSDPFVHKINLYGAPRQELEHNLETEEALLGRRGADASEEGKGDASAAAATTTTKKKKRKKLTPPFVPHNLMVQFFVRRDTSFSVMETKSFTSAESGVPAYYADAFNEGLKHLRGYFGQKRLQMLVIEWLRLQNPRQSFGERMPLPGQIHPGLGIGTEIDSVLIDLATSSHRDGILNLPEHWYNAYLYTRSRRPYKFLNPAFQGYFQSICDALEDDVRTRGLPAVAWAIFRGLLRCRPITSDTSFVPSFLTNTFAAFAAETQRDKDKHDKDKLQQAAGGQAAAAAEGAGDGAAAAAAGDHPIKWVSQEQVCPLTWQMSYYFGSPSYSSVVRKYYHPEAFYILWDDTTNVSPAPTPAPPPAEEQDEHAQKESTQQQQQQAQPDAQPEAQQPEETQPEDEEATD